MKLVLAAEFENTTHNYYKLYYYNNDNLLRAKIAIPVVVLVQMPDGTVNLSWLFRDHEY